MSEFVAIIRPPHNLILERDDSLGDSVNNPVNCVSTWAASVSHHVEETVCPQKMEEELDLKKQ
jgi:hypothetical protein